MPEFHLDVHDAYPSWKRLDSFTQGYIEALFFTEMEHNTVRPDVESDLEDCNVWNSDKHSTLPGDVTFADLSQEALATLAADCAAFQEANAFFLRIAKNLEPGEDIFKHANDALDDRRLGQLFWYARNGHGVAFTDDGSALCLQELQDVCRKMRERDVTFGDDEMIHVS